MNLKKLFKKKSILNSREIPGMSGLDWEISKNHLFIWRFSYPGGYPMFKKYLDIPK